VSVKVVAAPAVVATCEKFMQPEPWQRSIWTEVWPADPFVQRSRMDIPGSALAVRRDGAGGSAGFTTMEPVVVLDPPSLSVTVRDAV
jgi:hypothetical protein